MATNAHTEVPGAKPPFPPFNQQTFASQLLWLAIAFVLLYLLMSRLALPRVGGIIAARSGKIASDLAEAQKLKEASDAAAAAHEKKLAEARANAQAIAGQTRDKLMAEADQRRKSLEASLQQKLDEAERTIAATRTAAMSNVGAIASDAAKAIVERLTGAPAPDKAVADAVATVLKR
ncbi:MAG: F0F1 ATP synthase subunit B [Pseudorhodoplanes sp.]